MAEKKDTERVSERVVPVADGPDHGYVGTVRDDTPNDDYSVTGVTKRDDGDKPKPAARHSKS